MRKQLSLLLLLAFSLAANAQGAITVISGDYDLYAVGMSPDGEYITGQAGNQHHMFVWKKGSSLPIESDVNRLNTSQQGSNARGVSFSGKVTGICPNPNYRYLDPTEEGMYGDSNVATAALFDYETKTWTFLPIVTSSSQKLVGDLGSRAYALSDDGKTIVGGQNPGGHAYRWVAGYWKETTSNQFEYFSLEEDAPSRGSLAKTISGDGTLIGGFKTGYNIFTPSVALWVDKNKTGNYSEEIIPNAGVGCVEGISNNGRYVVLTRLIGNIARGYLFDREEQSLIDIDTKGSAALGVSDNGIVVGHWGELYYENMITNYNISMGRHIDDAKNGGGAFIFTEAMGTKALKDFFDENNITYPTGFTFKAATAISKDGHIICGHGVLNGKNVSFQAEIPSITATGIFPVKNFKIESLAYGSINLTWDAVPENDEFVGYKVFLQNGNTPVLVDTVKNNTSYNINNLSEGTYSYYIVSSYRAKDAAPTKTLKYTMGKKSLPFLEEFNYSNTSGLTNAYWDVSFNTITNSWFIDTGSGYPPGCMKFLPPLGGEYSESLTSPYYDATGMSGLYLSFIVGRIPLDDSEGGNIQKVAVEVFVDGEWILVEDISEMSTSWVNKSYDLSQTPAAAAVGKDNIRIRFRCHGNSNNIDLNWFLDNVELVDVKDRFDEEMPLAISTRYIPEEGVVRINWADPHGYVSLRYMNMDDVADFLSSVGNDSKTFIGVNMYPAEELKNYDGYKLTSLSFIKGVGERPEAVTFAPEFKWFVSQGGEPIFNDTITSVQDPGTWTTANLTEPIEIDVTKPLYYGVEVTKHHREDWPLAVGWMFKEIIDSGGAIFFEEVATAKGRGNLYSENGGVDWSELPEELIGDRKVPSGVFCVRATLTKDISVQPKDRLKGYRVLRNGVNLKGEGILTLLNNYIDTLPVIGNEACYEIQAFYSNMKSSVGAKDCIVINGIELINKDNSDVKVYPNLINRGETIMVSVTNVSISTIAIYDLSGKKVKEINAQGQSIPVQLNVGAGIYFLKVNDKETVKLIVK